MRQRTEVFASIILLATVLRQGRKKRLYQKSVSEFYRLLDFFYFIATFQYRKRNSKCLLYRYCKNN